MKDNADKCSRVIVSCNDCLQMQVYFQNSKPM